MLPVVVDYECDMGTSNKELKVMANIDFDHGLDFMAIACTIKTIPLIIYAQTVVTFTIAALPSLRRHNVVPHTQHAGENQRERDAEPSHWQCAAVRVAAGTPSSHAGVPGLRSASK